MAFDLFDLDLGGSIDPKGIVIVTCRIERSYSFAWNWGQSCSSVPDDSRAGFWRERVDRVRLILRVDDAQTQWAVISRVDP